MKAIATLEVGTSKTDTRPTADNIAIIRKNVLTSSTCSVVKGPPNLSLAKSNLEGLSSSQ